MKKIINILTFIFIIVLYHLTKNSNTFLLTFSFSLFLIYYSIFSSNKIKKLLSDYYDKKYLYTMNKVFKCSILLIIILTMLLGVISYIISTLINIEKLYLVNITMTIFLSISLIIKLINNYLNIFGYKKNILLNIYKLSSILFNIINIFLLYKVFLLEDYLKIIIIYLVPIILGILLIILSYILVVKKNSKYTKKREETKINYIMQIKKSLIDNRCIIIYNIINASYIYISIIVLYYILLNRYKYSYDDVSNYITNTYFYGIIIIYIIATIALLSNVNATTSQTDNENTNNDLASLSITDYQISPEFNKNTRNYYVAIPTTISSVEVNAQAESAKATVKITGNTQLTKTENTIQIVVTSAKGRKKTYKIIICIKK